MFFSRGRSKSSLRADAAEAELATLREKIQAMKVATASATRPTESTSPPRPKSASCIRADAAEAELARLREQMGGKFKKKFLKVTCKIGWCSHDGECPSADEDDLEFMKRKLAELERKLEQMQYFSMIRNEMERKIEKRVKEIRLEYAKASTLDLVIVMDCTGSMGSWIKEAKSAIVSIINNVKRDYRTADVRVGFVAYRDFCDGDKRLQIRTLTTDVVAVRKFISSLEAFGGRDTPEDIPGGLAAALEMPFEAEAKRIVLVGDAPCHGSRFNNGGDDMAYRVQIEQSPNICAQMREMATRGIDFTFIEVRPKHTAKIVAILEEQFDAGESYDGFGRTFERVSLEDAGDAARFANVVRSSASASISTSKERSVVASSKTALGDPICHYNAANGRPTAALSHVLKGDDEEEKKSPEEMAIVAPPKVKPLDWSEVYRSPDIAAIRHSLHFKPDELVDWKDLDLKHTQQDTTILSTRSCFSKGAMRSAHALYDCNMEKSLVAKFYFGEAARMSSSPEKSMLNDV